jgi:hypothetical protein
MFDGGRVKVVLVSVLGIEYYRGSYLPKVPYLAWSRSIMSRITDFEF